MYSVYWRTCGLYKKRIENDVQCTQCIQIRCIYAVHWIIINNASYCSTMYMLYTVCIT